MEYDIQQMCIKNKIKYIVIETPDELSKIHNLLINHILGNPETSNELYYFGVYFMFEYYDINNNALKYLSMAVDKNNINALYMLGYFYYCTGDDINAVKYYKLSSDHGNSDAMVNLGNYYYTIEDISNMIKYYLMAIEKSNSYAMYKLGWYYDSINDDINMEKYMLNAVENGHQEALLHLGSYYRKNKKYEEKIILFHKYNEPSEVLNAIISYFYVEYPTKISESIINIIINMDQKLLDKKPLYIKIIFRLIKQTKGIFDSNFE